VAGKVTIFVEVMMEVGSTGRDDCSAVVAESCSSYREVREVWGREDARLLC
jgi:hypothetical protein